MCNSSGSSLRSDHGESKIFPQSWRNSLSSIVFGQNIKSCEDVLFAKLQKVVLSSLDIQEERPKIEHPIAFFDFVVHSCCLPYFLLLF